MNFLADNAYINFKKYPNMASCKIGNNTVIHNTNFYNKYRDMQNIKHCTIPNSVTNLHDTYMNCINLTGSPVCGPKVTSMGRTYFNCTNLTGSPVCGSNVTNMYCTYENCYNLTGSPVCGPNVTIMGITYMNCINLTGSPVCGPNVTYFVRTYEGCTNLTGSPVCGPNVTDMNDAYRGCTNLTGSPVCGPKIKYMINTYYNCTNVRGNVYMFSDNVYSMTNCFYGRENNWTYPLQLVIIANKGSITANTLLINNSESMFGKPIVWTYLPSANGVGNDANCYNIKYNIFLAFVNNVVEEAKKYNEYPY